MSAIQFFQEHLRGRRIEDVLVDSETSILTLDNGTVITIPGFWKVGAEVKVLIDALWRVYVEVFHGSTSESGAVRRCGRDVFITWKLSLGQRLRVLFRGKVSLVVSEAE